MPENIDFAPYESFARSIKELVLQGNIVNIYSLNHDVLIEKIIEHFHLESYFCDGFTNADTAYFGNVSEEKQPLEYFANLYDKPIRLHKLHGSTSYYAFYKEIDPGSYNVGNIIKRPWGLDEFKLEYREGTKIFAGKTTRGMLSMEADFLTGATAKVYRYESPIYYKPQFDNFEADLALTDHLTVIGYGFKDFRVNELIQSHINTDANCIVVDPYIGANAEAEANKILPHLQIIRQGISEVYR